MIQSCSDPNRAKFEAALESRDPMASSKIMSTTSPSNQDPPRQPSLCSSPSTSLLPDLHNGQHHHLGSMNMDDLFKSIYASTPPSVDPHSQFPGGVVASRDGSFSLSKEAASSSGAHRMTLEDFLTKAGAVREDYAVDAGINVSQYPGFGSSDSVAVDNQRASGRRGKRKAAEEPPMDKATQQKQRRMIKNRESAARSRERKQAHTVELESLVTQLEEENTRLLTEEAEQKKQRLKQLMEGLIPVEEQRKLPRRGLRRVRSLQW